RTPIDRHVVDLGLGPRSVEDRFVIAGDEARVLSKARDPQGKKMLFEESARPGAVGNFERPGGAAGLSERRAERLGFGRSFLPPDTRDAARAKRPERLQMIVGAPAGDVAPRERRILAAADLKRPFKPRIGNGANFGGKRPCPVWK